jgi:uncharacterized protein YbaR (Trm112 family)
MATSATAMQPMTPSELADALTCPLCRGGRLEIVEGSISCLRCARTYPATDRGIVSFLLDEHLDQTNRNEIKGNTFNQEWEEKLLHKESWHPLHTRQMRWVAEVVERMLPQARDLYALGAGHGFDLKLILRRRSFERVFASDISPAATSMIGRALAEFPGKLGVFVSEFGRCPVAKSAGGLGLVFQALHHASDAHAALETLLDHSFDDLLVVEPITNPPLGLLARYDLVQRVEYTGTRPDWLSLPRVREIAQSRGYKMALQTWWEIPPYFITLFGRRPLLSASCYHLFDGVSRATNTIKFGSQAAIHLTRLQSS